MALVRWNPRDTFGLQREIDEMVNTFWGGFDSGRSAGWNPRVDVSESEDGYTIHAELPGIRKEDLNITLRERVLTIEGEKKETDEKKEGNRYRSERSYGKFSRSFKLPSAVQEDKIAANYSEGVLTLTVPKAESVKPKQIEVKVS